MVEIYFEDGTPVPNPNIVDKKSPKYLSYHMPKKLMAFLDEKIKKRITKHDKDYVMLVDGYEGAGKSTFAMQIGTYIDPTLCLERLCMTADEFKKAIMSAGKGECVIYDEAVTGLSAGESITRIGRLLKSLMMQMRQKNLFVIVILPSLFEFNKYAVLSRAMSFFHVYESSGRMGYWVGYNRKDMRMLYLKGKKTHSYLVRSRFNGRFYGKYTVNDEEYRTKKEEALLEMDEHDGRGGESKMTYQRKIFLVNWYLAEKRINKLTLPEFCDRLETLGITMKRQTLGNHLREARKVGKTLED